MSKVTSIFGTPATWVEQCATKTYENWRKKILRDVSKDGHPQNWLIMIDLRFGWIWGGPWYTLFLNKPISPLGAVCGRGVFRDVWSDTLLKDQANQRLCRIITTFRTARLARLVAKLERPLKTFKLIWRFHEMGVSPNHLFKHILTGFSMNYAAKEGYPHWNPHGHCPKGPTAACLWEPRGCHPSETSPASCCLWPVAVRPVAPPPGSRLKRRFER